MNDDDDQLAKLADAFRITTVPPFRLADQEQLNLTYPRLELLEDSATGQRALKVGRLRGTIELPDAAQAVHSLRRSTSSD